MAACQPEALPCYDNVPNRWEDLKHQLAKLLKPDLVLFEFSPTKWHVGFREKEPLGQHIHPPLFRMAEGGRGHRRDLSSIRE
uniref:SAM-dependent methyltransferase n=1 Tax=Angiostrongylus cantonensis TaxID=6313 RepID=A0A158PAI9_ANGCA